MTDRGVIAQNLTGVWHGRYFYPRDLAPVSFVATLFETASALTGTTHEPAGPATSALRYASLEGQRDGRMVVFVKTYTNAGSNAQPIDYSGRLNGDATEIEGIWRIRGNWSGKFLMIRSPGKAVSVERKVAERV
ncbi:hypothetical protein DPM33_16050 [Mesorhizobium hawassense]|uniref:Lipocalin-like domain-containing protein n=1 Tax=Mesorhizobium hawassense TaxID=1209954 RepID=A0A330HQ70_9HYPH|nr:hypothetical protein [Mesorhizobium hawassense]RAZ89702.1 hypothetical protein DPM33_16050 [Mesorhizobium hawassense]